MLATSKGMAFAAYLTSVVELSEGRLVDPLVKNSAYSGIGSIKARYFQLSTSKGYSILLSRQGSVKFKYLL